MSAGCRREARWWAHCAQADGAADGARLEGELEARQRDEAEVALRDCRRWPQVGALVERRPREDVREVLDARDDRGEAREVGALRRVQQALAASTDAPAGFAAARLVEAASASGAASTASCAPSLAMAFAASATSAATSSPSASISAGTMAAAMRCCSLRRLKSSGSTRRSKPSTLARSPAFASSATTAEHMRWSGSKAPSRRLVSRR
eukprot:2375277-Prymnesium_polylepis.1